MTKTPKVFNVRLNKTGRTYPVTLRFTKYTQNQALAVQLIGAAAPWSPFATLTVNLPDVPLDILKMWFGENLPDTNTLAFVDTNNCPWVEEFLKDNGIAEDTGIQMPSGFCTYPLYRFNLESQWDEKES